MGSRCLSWFAFNSMIFAAVWLTPAKGGEPTARDLIALAPVLDSLDKGCQSLDVGGWLGSDEPLAPKMRFRTFYKAPNEFSLLISDTGDGTPLVLCSGKKMLVYDPVGPTVYYSENASFTLELRCTSTRLTFNYSFFIKDGKPHHILVDFRSVMSNFGANAEGSGFGDSVAKRNANEFALIRSYETSPYLILNVDLAAKCPYTAAEFVYDGRTGLRLDRLALDGDPGNESFAFPAKLRVMRELPIKDLTVDDDVAANLDLTSVIAQATIVRAVLNRVGSPGRNEIPGLVGVDWDHVRENDRKYAKALRDLLSPSLRPDPARRVSRKP